MSYDQAMKHWRNHRKDRYFQQCYSPVSAIGSCNISENKFQELSQKSILKIINSAPVFPLYVHQNSTIGEWEVVSQNHLFGIKIETMESLVNFAEEYA